MALLLFFLILLFAFIIGTSVGIIAALKQNTIFDYIVMVITLVGVSMPIFWLALMLVLQFSVKMNLLPVMGMGDLSKGFGDVVSHMILPGFCLATIPMATFARTMRSSMIDIMSSDYIRCLRARGIKKLKVILIHGLKNALPPLITVLGLQIAGTFTGAIITEGIFSWPGMGTMINTAILLITHNLGVVWEMCDTVMVMYAGNTVEYADTKTLYKEPLHPYTWGLLDSMPKLSSSTKEDLKTIPGTPPDLRLTGHCCNFYNRCPYATEICKQQVPPLKEVAPGHFVACHRQDGEHRLTRGEVNVTCKKM